MKFFIIFIFFLISCQKSVMEQNKAVDLLQDKKLDEAFFHFTKAFEYDSFNPFIRYNFILFLVSQKKYDEAIKNSLSLISDLKDPKMRFEVLFNLSGIYSLSKKIPQALETYQKALNLDPKNHQIRVNIEFLFKKQKQNKQNKQNKENKEDKDKKENKKKNSDDQNKKSDQAKKEDQENKENSQKQENLAKKQNFNEKKDLNKKKMKKIYVDQLLDRLKQKENQIRMRKYQKQQKGRKSAKDW